MAEQGNSPAQGGQDDLAVLFPDRTGKVAGVDIAMREYRFRETLEHHGPIARFSDAITDIALRGDFADLDSLREAFGNCHDEVITLIAAACDQPADWVRELSADDGEQLMMLWWAVNAPFFLRRVLLSVGLRKAREVPGGISSLYSSPTDTAPLISPSTPSVN